MKRTLELTEPEIDLIIAVLKRDRTESSPECRELAALICEQCQVSQPEMQIEHKIIAARPLSDEDYGSPRQVDAENEVYNYLEQILSPGQLAAFEHYANKASVDERLDAAQRVVKGDVNWLTRWSATDPDVNLVDPVSTHQAQAQGTYIVPEHLRCRLEDM